MTKLPLLVLVVLLALGSAGAAGGKVYLPGAARSAARAEAHSASMTLAASLPKGGTVNSDIAFWGNLAYHGSYDGFRVIDISKPTAPSVLADVHCAAGQGDVTVWKNILVRSVDYPVTQRSCKGQRADDPTVAGQFEGLQIFDVSKPRHPRLVKLVDTDCGSHTNTLVPDTAHGRVLIYVLSYALLPGTALRRRPRGEPASREDLDRERAARAIPRAPRSWALRRSKRKRSTEASSVRRSAATTWASSCRCTSRPSPA